MTERKRWEYHPFDGPDDVNELTQKLVDLLGPDWAGWHLGDLVPGAAVWAQFTETESGRQILSGLLLLGDAITADMLRKVPVSALENSESLTNRAAEARLKDERARLPRLERDEDMSPEDFSRLVAEHYKAWARAVPHPAAAMAAEADVKPPTMHTWIREARLRGFLPPAKRGKG